MALPARSARVFDLLGVAGEFLAEPHRGGVHQMGAADLDDVPEFLRLSVERGLELFERGEELAVGATRAAATWMAVGMTSLLDCPMFTWSFGCTGSFEPIGLPASLRAAVRDDLVHVHVRARAGAGLENIDREMLVELAGDDFLRGLRDEVRAGGIEFAEFAGSPARRPA